MILRYVDIQEAACDPGTFSSNAPFRVPVPAEDAVRSVRQLPIETDPPEHTDYRAIVQPFFNRPRTPEMAAEMEPLIADAIDSVLDSGPTEMVYGFALPLQSRALALLLRMPRASAEEWIGWGRPLRRDEMIGFANLAFAGGRDTVINLVTFSLVHFAEHPEDFERLRAGDDRLIRSAIEEFVRVASPLTFIGRVCPHGAGVQGVPVAPDHRVGLCWASANRDDAVFEAPNEVRIDRKPNRHLGFGWGAHTCLGAFHARLVLRTLISQLCRRVRRFEIHGSTPVWEDWPAYRRHNGYEALHMSLHGR
jgi:cytochrome P450